ncbi:MAG: FkbM family methyltransferase [Bacteroidetes bacterium]|nr:FkbM family methyltransferase [Bacteroidota bacterium]
MKSYIPIYLRIKIKRLAYKESRDLVIEQRRLSTWPRFKETEVSFLYTKLKIVDIASFLFMKKEIFDLEIYKFHSKQEKPFIIDCGANIGLSVIYFKQLHPDSQIVAFEPDFEIFKVLKQNMDAFGFKDVQLIERACWNEETELLFLHEGADGGRKAFENERENIIRVKTDRLRNYLTQHVDFLKIDIEGAELVVLKDSADMLKNVERIFVEYHSFINEKQHLGDIIETLKDAGFRVHITAPGLTSPNPFIALSQYANMDNQLNIFGFRTNEKS